MAPGALAAGLAALIVVLAVLPGGGSGVRQLPAVQTPVPSTAGTPRPDATVRPAAASGSAAAGATVQPGSPQPTSAGRKIIQSAQLALTASPARIDDVAQQVFDVVGAENGVVNRSTVTATGGPDGYAQFDVNVPSANLGQAMSRLSRLHYARAASRTDTTHDVHNQYVAANRRLTDARALRTALLKQLANATTDQQISSLKAQLRDPEAAIAQAQSDLRALTQRVNFSAVSLTISASGGIPVAHGSGGFTLGTASHYAGRVLTVAAGVALIALAALGPLALLGALAWWITTAVRRRRREHALDVA